MIASAIGKKFLKVYNEHFHKAYSAKQFFVEIFYPLFFDHTKYMMTAGNSPLENPKISWDKMISGKIPFETEEKRNERFIKLMDKIENNEPDASIAIGYPSLDVLATTSCQVTNLNLGMCEDDVCLSWVGNGLGVGTGALSILFDKPEIMLDIFAGWQVYRDFLETMPALKGNQVNTWNGQWLAHRYSKKMYAPDDPTANFNPFSAKDGLISLDTQSWTQVLIAISMRYSDLKEMGYVYNIGQMNTTIGFMPFVLEQIRRPVHLYQKFFGIDNNRAELLFGTAFSFTKACQEGSIGVKALEPKGLKEYLVNGKIPKYDKENEEKKISFNIYQIWILAMLNNEELWVKAQELAREFQTYEEGAVQAKNDRRNKVKAVLQSTRKPAFIENLVPIVSEAKDKTVFENIAAQVNVMPTDNVPYFLTLVRFQYAVIQ